jgi:uncharacterized RDD family membrane protein YckC
VGVAGFSTTRSVSYAGFWLRFLAYVIDGLILGAATFAVLIPLLFLTGIVATLERLPHRIKGMQGQSNPALIGAIFSLALTFAAVALLLHWLYYAYLESGEKQGTWGKQALGLYVTDGEAKRISFGRASGRFFSKIITGLIPLGIGYIMAGFTAKKQALHDMIAGCLVLRR